MNSRHIDVNHIDLAQLRGAPRSSTGHRSGQQQRLEYQPGGVRYGRPASSGIPKLDDDHGDAGFHDAHGDAGFLDTPHGPFHDNWFADGSPFQDGFGDTGFIDHGFADLGFHDSPFADHITFGDFTDTPGFGDGFADDHDGGFQDGGSCAALPGDGAQPSLEGLRVDVDRQFSRMAADVRVALQELDERLRKLER